MISSTFAIVYLIIGEVFLLLVLCLGEIKKTILKQTQLGVFNVGAYIFILILMCVLVWPLVMVTSVSWAYAVSKDH